jgi:hypothetical protein
MAKTPYNVAAAALVCGLAGNLSAQTALRDQPDVRDGIIYVGMAYEISEQCNDIRARTFRGIGYLQSLKRRATELGYSDADIDAYVGDRDEKRRLEDIARAQLAQLGVVADDPATYCTVGHAQMAANTRVGWLLR